MQAQQENICFPTLINSHSVITGNISLTTDVRVDGTVHGVLESEKNIFIGVDGYVKGVVRANNLVSFGRIEGSVIVTGISVLNPGSILLGKLYTKDINVMADATLSAKVVTYDILDPIDEAQISLDEEKTRSLANKLSVAQKTLNSFPADYKRNQVMKETIHLDNMENEDQTMIHESVADTPPEEQPAIEQVPLQEVFADEAIPEMETEIFEIHSSEPELVLPEFQLPSVTEEPNPLLAAKLSTVSNPPIEVKKEEQYQSILHVSKNKSLIFNSLMNQTSAENTNYLINEVEKLNIASRESFTIKERKNSNDILSGFAETKFSKLKAVLK